MTDGAKRQTGPCQRARNAFGKAVVGSCCEHNCKLGLGGIANCVVLKGEKIAVGKKICDCIIIHDTVPPRVVLVELKSGGVKFDQVAEKFANGLRLLPQLDGGVFGNRPYSLSIVLLVKRRLPKTFYALARARRFKARGKKHSIMTLRCGANLAGVYEKMGRTEAKGRRWRAQ